MTITFDGIDHRSALLLADRYFREMAAICRECDGGKMTADEFDKFEKKVLRLHWALLTAISRGDDRPKLLEFIDVALWHRDHYKMGNDVSEADLWKSMSLDLWKDLK